MTREQQLQEIRDKCIEANPCIQDLDFGCVVQMSDRLPERVTALRTVGRSSFIITDVTREWWPIAELEIIGRPIRLADVLLAVYAVEPAMKTRINLECDGQFLTWSPELGTRIGLTWNLRADNLIDQSDETITFLHSLLYPV